MSKISTGLFVAALFATALPAAQAATPARAPVGTAAQSAIQPDQIRASKMIGETVCDVQNRSIGSVKDLVLNRDGRVAAVVLDVGSFLGMGGKYVAVKLASLKTSHNRLTLDATKERLQRMPNYQLANRNTGAGTSTSPVHGGHLGSGR